MGHKIAWIFFLEISVRAVLFHGINCYRQKQLIFFIFLHKFLGFNFQWPVLRLAQILNVNQVWGFTTSREARMRPVLTSGLFLQRFSTALRAANRRKIEFSEKFLEFSEKFIEFSKKILSLAKKTLEFRENSSRLIEISIVLHQLNLGFSKCTLENIFQTSVKIFIL